MQSQRDISEADVQRFLNDQASRLDWSAPWQHRTACIQRILAKIHSVSDGDFEAVFGAMESVLDSYQTRKAAKKQDEKKQPAEKALGLGEGNASRKTKT